MNHLGVFAKYWQSGRVKTRLAASIGDQNAAILYREFVRQTLERHAETADSRSLWISPPDKKPAFADLPIQPWNLEVQPDGDLGRRMHTFFSQSLRSECDNNHISRAVVIGSDSPNLDAGIIEDAFENLKQYPCVIGPSCDGGYYLIGMSRVLDRLFDDIPWSTPDVLPQTLTRLEELGIPVHLLPEWTDIDDREDLRALENQLDSLADPTDLDQQLLAVIRSYSGQSK